MPTPVALWHAADGLCSCCAKPMPEIGMESSKGARATIEHVFPRSPKGHAVRKIRLFYDLFPGEFRGRRTAMAHSKCNNRKGNRAPTGCEVVFLMAVNARVEGECQRAEKAATYHGGNRWGSTPAERTLSRKLRRKAAKERRALTDPIERLRAMPGAILVVTPDG